MRISTKQLAVQATAIERVSSGKPIATQRIRKPCSPSRKILARQYDAARDIFLLKRIGDDKFALACEEFRLAKVASTASVLASPVAGANDSLAPG